jgi:2-haloalkanoic acid dehalogenase type II
MPESPEIRHDTIEIGIGAASAILATAMKPGFEIVTFDCYGTLIDWESGISEAFLGAAAAAGLTLDRRQLLEAHAEIEPQVQSAGYRSYRDVLAETAIRMADRLGWSLDPAQAVFLPESLPGWSAFEDTGEALERMVAAGIGLGILSNIDDVLLDGTLSQLEVPFEFLITAESLRSYKPAAAHFEAARERVGERRWLHAAQSYFHDIEPAKAQGLEVAWVNRKNEQPGGSARPDIEVRTLAELADHLVGPPAP